MTALLDSDRSLLTRLERQGIDRRTFLKYCAGLTSLLCLPSKYVADVARALEAVDKPGLIWLEFQDCAGNTESFLRSRNPGVADIVLDVLSVDYHETIMAAPGAAAEAAREASIERGNYLVVVEGSIPTAEGGIYCTIGGKTARQILEETTAGAAGVISIGTCSSYGGIPAANPNPTGAVGVRNLVSNVPVMNLPGCPANADNITATLVHFLTFGALPAADAEGRPLFAYGTRIHDNCERRAHFDAGQFALEWGDEGHRKGWCLYKLGCKGPATYHNCPSIRWNSGTSWPIGAGHGCVGCSEPFFWDAMGPLYERLPKPPGFGVEITADQIGVTVVAATAVGFAAHGVAKTIQRAAEHRLDKPGTEVAEAEAEAAEAADLAAEQTEAGEEG